MEEKLFTQADVDEIVKKRLAREKRKTEQERNYKELYFDAMKQKSLIDAGVTFDNAERYVKYVDGEDEETISQQALEIANQMKGKPKNYADPSQKRVGIWYPFSK